MMRKLAYPPMFMLRFLAVFAVFSLLGSQSTAIALHADHTDGIFTGVVNVGGSDPEFSYTGDMSVPRILHTQILLENGLVLVAGGRDYPEGSMYASAELYNPSTGSWTATSSMSVSRSWHTGTKLLNGKVLVAGGWDNNLQPLASAGIFDPFTGEWSPAASMDEPRLAHQAILLPDGKVLVMGGALDHAACWVPTKLTLLYDPDTNTWNRTGDLNVPRCVFTATLLTNGKVLVAGGETDNMSITLNSAEIYDPATGEWTSTGSLSVSRSRHTATLLDNGQVLVAGGQPGEGNLSDVEIYDPETGTWSTAANMLLARREHVAIKLGGGRVLVIGGIAPDVTTSTEIYDPATGNWTFSNPTQTGRSYPGISWLQDGRFLITGGFSARMEGDTHIIFSSAETGQYTGATNTFTATMTLPDGWLTNSLIPVSITATSSDAALVSASLSSDGLTWGDWISITNDVPVETTWTLTGDGTLPIYLRLRDSVSNIAVVVTGYVNIDLTPPAGTVNIDTGALYTDDQTVVLTLSAEDSYSGLGQMRFSNDAANWSVWEVYDTQKEWTLTSGDGEKSVYVQYQDNLGNISLPILDTIILEQSPPVAISLLLNQGALATTVLAVNYEAEATDAGAGVGEVSLSNDGVTWGEWLPYASGGSWTLTEGDGNKTVYLRVRDLAGNISETISASINLDTSVRPEYGFTINRGALFVNTTAVVLSIGALPGTPEMIISNDGGFADAQWESYTSQKPWTITSYEDYAFPRTVYLRYKDPHGVISATYQDDIILDMTAPEGSFEIVSASSNGSVQPALSLGVAIEEPYIIYLPFIITKENCIDCIKVRLLFTASDDLSGVGYVRISNSPDFPYPRWKVFEDEKEWWVPAEGTTMVYVQFRDYAGNVSPVYSDTYTP